MQLRSDQLDTYVADLAELLERYGVVLSKPAPGQGIELLEDDAGRISFELIGGLPDGRQPPLATLQAREEFTPADEAYRRSRYEFELIDLEREFRRAYHLHFAEWFETTHLVVVHEHCELPIGQIRCQHYEGSPIRDGYQGVMILLTAWAEEPPDCSSLPCLG
ncbi:hypothetical protein BH24CHL7_BH24CHL7_12460 [soil metagenome]